jgi:hypothetical protein
MIYVKLAMGYWFIVHFYMVGTIAKLMMIYCR